MDLDLAGAGKRELERAGARVGGDGGLHPGDLDSAGPGMCGEVGGAGRGDVVVDGDVAEEVGVSVGHGDGDRCCQTARWVGWRRSA